MFGLAIFFILLNILPYTLHSAVVLFIYLTVSIHLVPGLPRLLITFLFPGITSISVLLNLISSYHVAVQAVYGCLYSPRLQCPFRFYSQSIHSSYCLFVKVCALSKKLMLDLRKKIGSYFDLFIIAIICPLVDNTHSLYHCLENIFVVKCTPLKI